MSYKKHKFRSGKSYLFMRYLWWKCSENWDSKHPRSMFDIWAKQRYTPAVLFFTGILLALERNYGSGAISKAKKISKLPSFFVLCEYVNDVPRSLLSVLRFIICTIMKVKCMIVCWFGWLMYYEPFDRCIWIYICIHWK